MHKLQNRKNPNKDVIGKLTIPSGYVGPPGIANGGYVCGLMANFIDGPADVVIRRPTPVEQEMQVVASGDGHYYLMDGENVVVQAKAASLDLEVPQPPNYEMAVGAAKTSIALKESPYPGWKTLGIHPFCFCCGADGSAAKGLKIHPGRIDGSEIVAAPWIPAPELGNDSGYVRPEFIWTALDCPGAFAFLELTDHRPGMSGRLIGQIDLPLPAGEPCVVIAWPVAVDGKKLFAGTAVFNAEAQLVGRVLATWFSLPPENGLRFSPPE
jgi:hypothetical protein